MTKPKEPIVAILLNYLFLGWGHIYAGAKKKGLIFAPKLPEGVDEGNWIQTIPGKSWFIILRMYGPLEPWLDQSWRPSELELVQ